MPIILAIDMADEHRENLATRPEVYGPEVLRRLRAGEPHKGTDYAHALRIIIRWKHQFKALFHNIDMIVTPTTPIVAPKFADSSDLQKATHGIMRNLVGFSYAGVPCLSIPVGFDFRVFLWACRLRASGSMNRCCFVPVSLINLAPNSTRPGQSCRHDRNRRPDKLIIGRVDAQITDTWKAAIRASRS